MPCAVVFYRDGVGAAKRRHVLLQNTKNSVAWMGRDGGDFLGVGTNHSAVQLWDASKLRQVNQSGSLCVQRDFGI